MAGGRNGIALVGTHQLMADRSYISQLQDHIARQFPLHVEVEVVNVRYGVLAGIGADRHLRVAGPVQLGSRGRIDIGKWIWFCLAARDIYERICEGRASAEILRAEGILEAWRVAEILQLALFRIAIPVHAEAAADHQFMRAGGSQQTGRARARRPGESKTRTKVRSEERRVGKECR